MNYLFLIFRLWNVLLIGSQRHDLCGGLGVYDAVRWSVDYEAAVGTSECVWLLLLSSQAWRVARERVHCANSTSSFVTCSCACASILFPAEVISLAVAFCQVIKINRLNIKSRYSPRHAASQRCTRNSLFGVLFRIILLTVVSTKN
jgi:hypothetical protein